MGRDDSFPDRPSTRDQGAHWAHAEADLPSPPELAEGLHRQLTDRQTDAGFYERTRNHRTDGIDRYERSVVLVGRMHRSVIDLDVTSSGLVVVTHRLVRERTGLLDRLRRGGRDDRRGLDAETLDLLQSKQRTNIESAVDDEVVRYRTTEKLAGFVLGFESATSATPGMPPRTAVSEYLTGTLPDLVSRVIALERRAQST